MGLLYIELNRRSGFDQKGVHFTLANDLQKNVEVSLQEIEDFLRVSSQDLEKNGVEEIVLMGHSQGGVLAKMLADKYGEKIRGNRDLKVITVCSPMENFHPDVSGLTEQSIEVGLSKVETLKADKSIFHFIKKFFICSFSDFSKNHPGIVDLFDDSKKSIKKSKYPILYISSSISFDKIYSNLLKDLSLTAPENAIKMFKSDDFKNFYFNIINNSHKGKENDIIVSLESMYCKKDLEKDGKGELVFFKDVNHSSIIGHKKISDIIDVF